jgi:hypothetical protein
MGEFGQEHLSHQLTTSGETLTLELKGEGNTETIDVLANIIAATHARARAEKASEVVVDIKQLEFMNSSCFKKLVTWLDWVQELNESDRYRIRFRSSEAVHWQRRSLQALQCFAVDLVSVDL